MSIGVEGRRPATSTTCEEASIFSFTKYVACDDWAVGSVFHPRDNKTYAMCRTCIEHNCRNRGGVLIRCADSDLWERYGISSSPMPDIEVSESVPPGTIMLVSPRYDDRGQIDPVATAEASVVVQGLSTEK